MGGSQSIDNTILGRSLVGKKFRTKGVTCFSAHFSGYDRTYYISKWDDHCSLVNPNYGEFDIKVSSPIEFEIISLIKSWGIDTGHNMKIKIKILNNIPLSKIENIREGTDDHRWIIREDLTSLESMCDLFKYQNNLIIHGLDCRLSVSHFGFEFVKLFDKHGYEKGYDKNTPYVSFNTSLLELVNDQ